MITARLTQPIEASLRGGNPWIFEDAIQHPNNVRAGDIVRVVDTNAAAIGNGVIEPDHPIRIRLWTLAPDDTKIDNDLLAARIRAALKRRPFPTSQTSGFRALNGEGDLIPGVTVDVYENVGVIRLDGRAAERWAAPTCDVLTRSVGLTHFAVVRSERYRGDAPTREWLTAAPPADIIFREHGLRFICRPISGQKTGFFLDQRDNRARIAELAAGKRLLNLFGYSGGFSVAAAAAGAAYTVTVDQAQPALDDARLNFELNDLVPDAHGFERADVFDFLEQFDGGIAPFDIIVCDPPSFVHRRSDLTGGTEAYVRLFTQVMRCARNGAVVALGSCSSHVDGRRFRRIVADAAEQACVSYVVGGIHGAGADHPWPIGFPAANYLQFAIGTVMRT